MLQVIERMVLGNAGRHAVSYFHSQGEHLGQALDSGGSDHIAGQRDVEGAYDCMAYLTRPYPCHHG
jgi:hypothetical protein